MEDAIKKFPVTGYIKVVLISVVVLTKHMIFATQPYDDERRFI